MHAFLGKPLDYLQAELSQFDPVPRQLWVPGDDAQHISRGRIGIHAQKEIRSGKIEEAQSMRLYNLGEVHELAQLFRNWRNTYRHDGVTGLGRGQQMADRADPADACRDARHLVVGMSLGEFFKAPHLRDVKFRSRDVPLIIEPNRNLGVSLDAAHRFDGDALHGALLNRISPCAWRPVSCHPAGR